MNPTELDSFVLKFKHLWRSGLDAHLDLECQAGQAWVGLRVCLGHDNCLLPSPYIPRRNRNSPSRLRRRARREAARQKENQHAEEASGDIKIATEKTVLTVGGAGIAEKAIEK